MNNNFLEFPDIDHGVNRPKLEIHLQILALVFSTAELVIRENPGISPQSLQQKLLVRLLEYGIPLSSEHKDVINKLSQTYGKALQGQLNIIGEWFLLANKERPETLKEMELAMTEDESVNFHAWIPHAWRLSEEELCYLIIEAIVHGNRKEVDSFHEKIESEEFRSLFVTLSNGKDFIAQFEAGTLNVEGFSELLATFDQEQRMLALKDIHRITGKVGVDITSRPLAIELYYPSRIFQMEGVNGYYVANTGITVMRKAKESELIERVRKAAEHEYQHLLRDLLIRPVQLGIYHPNGEYASRYASGIDRRIVENSALGEAPNLWNSMQDEICSYLGRDGVFVTKLSPYLTLGQQRLLEAGNIAIEDMVLMSKVLVLIDSLLYDGIGMEDIVNIVRTSGGFDIVIERLVFNFPKCLPVEYIRSLDSVIQTIVSDGEIDSIDKKISIGDRDFNFKKFPEDSYVSFQGKLPSGDGDFLVAVDRNDISSIKEILLLSDGTMNPFKKLEDAQQIFSGKSIEFRTKKYFISSSVKDGIILVRDRNDAKIWQEFTAQEFISEFISLQEVATHDYDCKIS